MYCYLLAVLISMYSAHSLAFFKAQKGKFPDISFSLLPQDTKVSGSPTDPCIRAVIEVKSKSDYAKGESHNTIALDLSQNKLKECIDVSHYPNLHELNLSTNLLTKFPCSIFSCRQLTRLNLAHNRLKIIPREICELINLILLDVSNNSIETLPEDIVYLLKLTSLNVSYNAQFKNMPAAIYLLKHLTSCNVTRTKLPERSINQLIETFGQQSIHH